MSKSKLNDLVDPQPKLAEAVKPNPELWEPAKPPNPPANEPPKKRRTLSSSLQAMANIEREMERLTPDQTRIVVQWFAGTYMGTQPPQLEKEG